MRFKNLFYYLLISLSTISCVNMNMLSNDSSFKEYKELIDSENNRPSEIRVGDKFSISVWNHDDLSIGSIYGIYNSNQIFGKWQIVKSDSTILFPKIGSVDVVGLTVEEAEKKLTALYSIFIVEPIVTIQIHSHTVELLGQVSTPGKITLFNHKHTIVEALALTGGYTDYANISKTKLMRDGVAYTLDLTTITPKELSTLYLKPGDLIFVPSRNVKKVQEKSSLLLAVASILTTLIIIFR